MKKDTIEKKIEKEINPYNSEIVHYSKHDVKKLAKTISKIINKRKTTVHEIGGYNPPPKNPPPRPKPTPMPPDKKYDKIGRKI